MRRVVRAVRPDTVVCALLGVVALVLFVNVRLPADLTPTSAAPPPDATPPAHVQDFAFVLNYARHAAMRPGVSPYTYDAHRRFFHAWLGPRVRSALCFPYGWATMLVLLPLFPLTTAWAWLVWNLVSAWLAGWAVRVLPGGDATALQWARLSVMGATAFHCLVNGQTGLFTTGCFVAAMRLGAPGGRVGLRALAGGVALLALTIKPPLAGMAALALLVAGRPRPVAAGAVLVASSMAFAAAWWTPAMFGDYVTLVRQYNLVDADEIVRAGCVPGAMSNLRALLLRAGWLDDSRAFVASGWVLAAALAIPAAVLVRGRRWPLDVTVSWVVVAYLLFAPHLSPTEDLLLIVPLTALLRRDEVRGWLRVGVVLGCVGPQWMNGSALQLGQLLGGGRWLEALPPAAFAMKLLPVFAVVRCIRGGGRTLGTSGDTDQGNEPTMCSPRRSTYGTTSPGRLKSRKPSSS